MWNMSEKSRRRRAYLLVFFINQEHFSHPHGLLRMKGDTMKRLIPLVICAVLLAACSALSPTSTPAPNLLVSMTDSSTTSPAREPSAMPYAPQPEDNSLTRGNIFIEEKGLIIRESYPPQIALSISGNLPTPCHQLRAVAGQPDAENKIHVEAYTVVDPNMMCTQVLKPFSENIELGTFPSGHYTVWVNGELAGEFDS
jgi:hypothetical protein